MSHARTGRVSIRLSLEDPAAASADSCTNSAEAWWTVPDDSRLIGLPASGTVSCLSGAGTPGSNRAGIRTCPPAQAAGVRSVSAAWTPEWSPTHVTGTRGPPGSPARPTWGTCSRRPNLGGDDAAALALDVWAHLARALVATMAAAMDGLDVLAFSGGVSEHRPALRHPLRGGRMGLERRTAQMATGRERSALPGWVFAQSRPSRPSRPSRGRGSSGDEALEAHHARPGCGVSPRLHGRDCGSR
jgi:hypothetical protein